MGSQLLPLPSLAESPPEMDSHITAVRLKSLKLIRQFTAVPRRLRQQGNLSITACSGGSHKALQSFALALERLR